MSNTQIPGLPFLPDVPKERDPVCGMIVDPLKAAGKAEYAGKTYHFCSARCAERFRNEATKFLAAPGTSGMERPMPAPPTPVEPVGGMNVRYTCPMHPEIVQMGPGSCPICGMALEPMDIVAEVEADPEYDSMKRRFWVSAALSLPVLLLAMFGDVLKLPISSSAINWMEFVLATPVVLWGGWPFFHRFSTSVVNRSPNMFTLIGLGTGAAYLESVAATLFPQIFPIS